MDPTSAPVNPAELYELLGIVGGVVVSGLLGFLLVRRARAVPPAQIEGVERGPGPAPPREAQGPHAGGRRTARRAEAEPEARSRSRAPKASRREPEPAPAARKPARAPARGGRPTPAPPEPERAARAGHPVPRPGARPQRAPRSRPAWRARAPASSRAWARSSRASKEIDPSVVDEIEKVLLTADIGVRTSQKLLEEIRSSLSRRELADPDAVWAFLRRRATEMLSLPAPPIDFGVGAAVRAADHRRQRQRQDDDDRQAGRASWPATGKKVLLAAGDTFRAAAVEQLDVWARRTGDDARARQGGRRPVVGDLRRRQARRDRGLRRRDRRHRRPPAHEDRSDAGAAEGPPRGRQGEPGRAARDLAGDRFDERPERDRAGADLHRGDGGVRVSC